MDKQLQMAVHSKQLLLVAFLIAATKSQPISKPDCQTDCGNVTIPFPFGLTENCSLNSSFLITCNHTLSSHTPFLKNNHFSPGVRVLDISLDGELNISLPVARDCIYYSELVATGYSFDLRPFHLSSTRNKLTVVGGNTVGIVGPTNIFEQYSACVSLYDSESITNRSCSGIGCCEIPIPPRLSNFSYFSFPNVFNKSIIWQENPYPCSYAFLVIDGEYQFYTTRTDLLNLSSDTTFPVVVDWAVGNNKCQDAKSASSYACKSDHSECYDAKVGQGYLCNCSSGFRGNPYISDGCRDVNECEESNDCSEDTKCVNSPPGSYSCSCPKGYEGDGKINGTGCKFGTNRIIIIALSEYVIVCWNYKKLYS
ncbi:Wall-associated receptor kinase 2 [Spatholobus suberectus]|nr:Wall-associated receptor kinase 2 [Spatholobus suberectus]